MIPASLANALTDICGPAGVILDRDRLLVYESDALTAYRHRPGAVVLPRTTDEVCRSLRAVADHGLPVVPRGAGTGLSGGAVALDGAVVIGTARMNRILEIDAANRRAVLQPGVINAELSAAAAPHGLYYAPDPSSQTACTIGGNVAENSGGPHCLKWGTTSRWVTGLEVALPDGSLARIGGLGREVPGYDLTGLFVGSEGCFGIAVEIEVALLPLPEAVRTLLAIFDRIEDAGRAVSSVIGAGLLPAAMEIIDGATIRAVEDSVFAAGYPTDAEAAMVVEFDGVEAGLDAETKHAEKLCRRAGAREVRRAQNEAERAALWKGRKKAFGAMGRIAPDLLVQDATVPRTRLPEVLKGIARTGKSFGLTVANVFHAGDGNLHPNILFDRRDAAELERVEAASKKIMRLCIDAGGTITGEHGVGLDKIHHMHLVCGPAELGAMWGVRRVFDPEGTMNPGKVLPADSEPENGAAKPGSGSALGGRRRTAAPDRLLRLFPPDRLLEGAEAREWCRGVAGAVVFPESAEDVQAVVRAAGREGFRVLPAGHGSWLRAGGWGRRASVVVSVARMNAVRHYEPADLTLTAGAGIRWGDVSEAARANGQWLPLDPPGSRAGTLGGLVACGVSGPLASRYGAVRDNVLGVAMVTGDGMLLRLGGRVVKNVAGYDLVRLATGSRGSLGVITEVSVRLFPRPETAATLVFRAGPQEAVAMARAVCASEVPRLSVELAEDESELHGEVAVAVRLGGGRPEVEASSARVVALAGSSPSEILRDAESDAFHEQRTRWEDGAGVVARITALPSHLGETFALGRQLADAAGEGQICADAMAGVVRVRGKADAAEQETFAQQLHRTRRSVEALGGTFTLSLGLSAASPPRSAAEHDLTGRLKTVFDPASVLASQCP